MGKPKELQEIHKAEAHHNPTHCNRLASKTDEQGVQHHLTAVLESVLVRLLLQDPCLLTLSARVAA